MKEFNILCRLFTVRGITPTQLLAHLQQLDPAIATAATPSQLQLLQQKHQQLWTLQQQVIYFGYKIFFSK